MSLTAMAEMKSPICPLLTFQISYISPVYTRHNCRFLCTTSAIVVAGLNFCGVVSKS